MGFKRRKCINLETKALKEEMHDLFTCAEKKVFTQITDMLER